MLSTLSIICECFCEGRDAAAQGRTQDFCSGGADEPSGGQWRRRRRRASAAGARIEALAPRGVGAGGGVPLPRQLGGLGERCKLPQWGPGRSPGSF